MKYFKYFYYCYYFFNLNYFFCQDKSYDEFTIIEKKFYNNTIDINTFFQELESFLADLIIKYSGNNYKLRDTFIYNTFLLYKIIYDFYLKKRIPFTDKESKYLANSIIKMNNYLLDILNILRNITTFFSVDKIKNNNLLKKNLLIFYKNLFYTIEKIIFTPFFQEIDDINVIQLKTINSLIMKYEEYHSSQNLKYKNKIIVYWEWDLNNITVEEIDIFINLLTKEKGINKFLPLNILTIIEIFEQLKKQIIIINLLTH